MAHAQKETDCEDGQSAGHGFCKTEIVAFAAYRRMGGRARFAWMPERVIRRCAECARVRRPHEGGARLCERQGRRGGGRLSAPPFPLFFHHSRFSPSRPSVGRGRRPPPPPTS